MPIGASSFPPLVWAVTLPASVTSDRFQQCFALLDDSERECAAAFKLEPPRRQYVVAHALLRSVLSSVAPVPPRGWRFDRGAHGKPHVAGAAAEHGLSFSLSHTAGAVAVAVSGRDAIGVDVQAIDRAVNVQQFRTCLAAAEMAELNDLAPERRRQHFYELWAAKEAVAKAVGTGVSPAMAGIRIVTQDGRLRSTSDDDRYAGWHLTKWQLPVGTPCVAATRETTAVKFRLYSLDSWLATVVT